MAASTRRARRIQALSGGSGGVLSEFRLERRGRCCFKSWWTHGEIFALAWRFFSRAPFSGRKESSGGFKGANLDVCRVVSAKFPQRWHQNLNGRGVDASFQAPWRARDPRVSSRCAGDWAWGRNCGGPTGKSGLFKSDELAYFNRLNMGCSAQLGP